MGIVVQKYGGSCVATPRLIKRVADRVIKSRRTGDDVLVVMSAMGDMTDDLIALAGKVSSAPCPRELDMLISVGERISMSLLSMAIHDLGFDSISLTGSQSGIITTCQHNRARIVDVRPDRIINSLSEGKIVIVAGFQGVSRQKEITTLGRGGSDLTAVALARALAATKCELVKSVRGVMSGDPEKVPDAQLLPTISADSLVELSTAGASVIDSRAARFVRRHGIPVVICSLDEDDSETVIVSESVMRKNERSVEAEDSDEAATFTAVASRSPVVCIGAHFPAESHQSMQRVLTGLCSAGIAVYMVNLAATGGSQNVDFVVSDDDLQSVEAMLEVLASTSGLKWTATRNLAMIGFIGDGYLLDMGPVCAARAAFSDAAIDALRMHASAFRISVLVQGEDEERALLAAHNLVVGSE
ncbi:aspartate kinase [bacterium]|nr:aspartate kinase [bacterium]